ncbi:nuclear transport factor 2 family protein [Pseudonocardia acaciae]|uniref:nuclear transport factor 2 family protein n=1 Tax=Pseudonocardia acaciae TaxID=551276 RepID=UPI000687E1B1|nr:nuclear transport factor 2 family protein [Pseudonocardia acaciae]
MTSSSIADTILDLFSTIDSGKWDRLGDLFTPDAVYRRPGFEEMRGIESITRFYEHGRLISSGDHTISGIVVDGGRAACWGRLSGRLKSGDHIEVEFADVYIMAHSRIVERTSYFYAPLA